MSHLRQKQGEASSAYTQDIDNGTSKERTAFETMTLLQQVNAVLGGLLAMAFRNEAFSDREICRRFTIKSSIDPDVREFWKLCSQAKIPPQYLNYRLWKIEREIPLGQGNQTLEVAAATQLYEVRGALNPEAQQLALNIYIAAITKNPKLAQRLAPVGGKKGITDGERDAQAMFGSLMSGGDVDPRPEYSPIEQAGVLLKMSFDVTSRIEATGNTASMQEIAGLSNVATYIQELINQMSQDIQNEEIVKQYADAHGQLMNLLKGYAQRAAEEQNSEQNSEAQAKAETTRMLGEIKAEISQMNAEQKREQKDAEFQQRMAQQQQEHELRVSNMLAEAQAEMTAKGLKDAQELEHNEERSKQQAQIAKKQAGVT